MRSLIYIFIFPFSFFSQTIHRDLTDSKWNAPEILNAKENPVVLKHARIEPYGHFLELKSDSTFSIYNSAWGGNDCFRSYRGTFKYLNWSHLILDFKEFHQHGFCETQEKKFQKNELKRDFIVRAFHDTLLLYKGFGQPSNFVTDRDSLLSELEEQTLNQLCKDHESKTSNEICIVTLDGDVGPYKSLKDYTLDMANYWGVGKKGKDNGIMIAISSEMKEVRIHVGHWLVDELTDQDCKWIINNVMLPEFKKGNYFEGLKSGINKILDELK